MRGEDRRGQGYLEWHVGSPPHARGRRGGVALSAAGGGITPACAGKTVSPTWNRSWAADHPRMRGEDSDEDGNLTQNPGSPPHARGRRRDSRG